MILSIGAGKSSFFNGIESAFEGHVTGRANAGQIDESLTTQETILILIVYLICSNSK